jgi:hypothetical protein
MARAFAAGQLPKARVMLVIVRRFCSGSPWVRSAARSIVRQDQDASQRDLAIAALEHAVGVIDAVLVAGAPHLAKGQA